MDRDRLLKLISELDELEYSCPYCGAVAGACPSYPDCPEGIKNKLKEENKYSKKEEDNE
mgnify:CR=1 FL=1